MKLMNKTVRLMTFAQESFVCTCFLLLLTFILFRVVYFLFMHYSQMMLEKKIT